jgi:ABC-type branched-subunit amino acid transport system substrate-binding protein
MFRRRGTLVCAATAVVAVVLSALAPAAGAVPAAASGKKTVRIMVAGSFTTSQSGAFLVPEAVDGAKGRIQAANKAGEVKGVNVVVDVCDDKADPNVGTKCTDQAVSNGDVAVIFSFGTSAAGAPVLTAANIPMIGLTDLNAANAFPLEAGNLEFAGIGAILVQGGCKKVGTIRGDIAATQSFANNIGQGATASKGQYVGDAAVSLATPDYSPALATLTSKGAQCIGAVISPTQVGQLFAAISGTGKQMPVGMVSGSLPPDVLKTLGTQADGAILVTSTRSATDVSVPAVRTMDAEIKKVNKSANLGTYAVNAWTAAALIVHGMQDVTGAITGPSLLAAMNKFQGVDVGTIAPYTTTVPNSTPGQSRVFDTSVIGYKITKGVPKLYGKGFVDIGALLGVATPVPTSTTKPKKK